MGQVRQRPALLFGGAGEGAKTTAFGTFGQFVFAIDAETGDELWRKDVGLFPGSILTGGIVQHVDRLIVPISAMGVGLAMNPNYECCKSHGAVRALDADTGEILWTAHMTEDARPTSKNALGVQQWGPSGAAVWTTPTIDSSRNLVYVGTGENTSSPASRLSDAIVAIDILTGEIRWAYQGTKNDAFNAACLVGGPNCPEENGPDFDFGASAVLAQTSQGDDIILAGQKSGVVHALNPGDGELLWRTQVSPGSALGGVHWGMAVSGNLVIVPINDPVRQPGHERKPGVYALDIVSGDIRWSHHATAPCENPFSSGAPWVDCPYTFSAAASASNDLAFAGSLAGVAYAFAVDSGEVVWQFDTAQAFETVNGIPAHGGSIDNPGIQIAGDMLFVESGYAMFGEIPGNALLAFKLRP
jgi:polyvinyl alcohol dehydrogenase (cytochrome)